MADAAADAADATDAAEVDEADLAHKAADAAEVNEADEADLIIKADSTLLDVGIAIVYLFLYSLTKYSAIVAKMKGYLGRTISNQRKRWSVCSLGMQDQVKFNNQLEVDDRSQSNN